MTTGVSMPRPALALGLAVLVLAGAQAASPEAVFGQPPVPERGAGPRPGSRATWLDRPLVPWNRAGDAVPAAPAPEGEPARTLRCDHVRRPPALPEDQAVTARRVVAAIVWTVALAVQGRSDHQATAVAPRPARTGPMGAGALWVHVVLVIATRPG